MSLQLLPVLVYLSLILQATNSDSDCQYAFSEINPNIPIKLHQCNDMYYPSPAGGGYSLWHQYCGDSGYLVYHMFGRGQKNCAHFNYADSVVGNTRCYNHTSVTKCKTVTMKTYLVPGEYEYIRDTEPFVLPSNLKHGCFNGKKGQSYYVGESVIYDICLPNPGNLQLPFVKSEYNAGGSGFADINCSYTVNYYSDKKCENKIGSAHYNESCTDILVTDHSEHGFSYDFPECYDFMDTVNVLIIASVNGCFVCICCCCIVACNKDKLAAKYGKWRRRRQQQNNVRNVELSINARRSGEERKAKTLHEAPNKATKSVTKAPINYHIGDVMIDKQPTLSYSVMNCMICLDGVLDNEASTLICGHRFHTHCIEEYNETSTQCPLCRQNIAFKTLNIAHTAH